MKKGLLHGTYGTKVISTPLFLDLFPGAKVAYSFRKLRRDYRGSCIRLQHDVSLREIDVGFINDYLDVEFCNDFLRGATRGYVLKLYDQSGNGNNATLTGAAAPSGGSIYTNGINYRNGRVILKQESGGTLGYYSFTSFSAVTDWSAFVVYKRNASGVDGWYFSSTSRGVLAGAQYRDNIVYHQVVRNTGVGNGTFRTIADNNNTYNLFSSHYQISPLVSEVYKRGVAVNLSAPGTFNPNGLNFNTIGAYNSTTSFVQAELSEAILYTKYMGHIGPAMNENIMRFYDIEHFK